MTQDRTPVPNPVPPAASPPLDATDTPDTPDTPDTRRRILDAASEVFANHGFKDATVRDICTQAQVNIAAVNYHFGGKDKLYEAVFLDFIEQALAKHPPTLGVPGDAPAEVRLQGFIRGLLRRILDDGLSSRAFRLMTREMVDPTAALDVVVQRMTGPLFAQLRDIVRQIVGPAPDDEAIRHAAASIAGQCLFYRLAQPMILRLNPGLTFTPPTLDALADHIHRFSLAGLSSLASAPRKAEA